MKNRNKKKIRKFRNLTISDRLYLANSSMIIVPVCLAVFGLIYLLGTLTGSLNKSFDFIAESFNAAAADSTGILNFFDLLYHNLSSDALVSNLFMFIIVLIVMGVINFFLSRVVFRRISDRIDLLSKGVNEIHEGNLDYRINYPYNDEFKNICNDFDDMALRLQKSVIETQKNESSRRELFASISHDIRSPLTSIMAYSEGLMNGIATDEENRKHYYAIINKKATDIERMTAQLMYLSKVEMGDMSEHPENIRLGGFIREYLDENDEIYANQNMQIAVAEMDEVTVMADYGYLNRIFTNIIENSIKYKNKETGHMEICLKKLRNYCCLCFSDDGPGVSEEALDHIFDVFYRSDAARQNTMNGSGLGLSIVTNIVKRMNGYVLAENRAEGGLKITIKLPMIKESEDE